MSSSGPPAVVSPMTSETTPLIVRSGGRTTRFRRRPTRNVFCRFLGVSIASIFLFSLIIVLLTLFTCWDLIESGTKLNLPSGIRKRIGLSPRAVDHDQLVEILLETPSAKKAEKWSRYYTAGPHLAGKNLSQAEWTRDRWAEWGVKSEVVAYDVFLNYPQDHALRLLEKPSQSSKKGSAWEVKFQATLEEDVLEEDPTTGLPSRIPTFHGYSASGNVTAPFVFVNYGTYQDFEDLQKANVSLEGKIAIARYGSIFRGLKVKRAQDLGMVGCLIYSDPGDDGEITEANGYAPYPKGPARNPSSVQRGSVQNLSIRPGDPSTPGYPSKPGVPRAPVDDAIPSIPSIPISYAEAIPILSALNGYGPKAADFNKYWTRNLGLGYKGVDYNVGPSPENVVLNLYNEQEYVTTPLWNVIGIINGTIPNEVVIIGNHRDAWIAGGAVDPNSGSAVVNEVVRSFGAAVAAGWKPLRTIVFASWDGEEYALIGSTEWVEDHLPWLDATAVAYLNVDVGVSGPVFHPAVVPVLHDLLRNVTHAVPSPNQTVPGQTVGDVWDGSISTLGSGSDFTAFLDFAGIPSLDMGFKSDGKYPYHYHSNYDSFYWMSEYGDPGFTYHRTMAQVLGLLTAELADQIVIPFEAANYPKFLAKYLEKITGKLGEKAAREPETEEEIANLRARPDNRDKIGSGTRELLTESLHELHRSIQEMQAAATKVDKKAAWCRSELAADIPWWQILRKLRLGFTIAKVNFQYKVLDRAFLHAEGLDSRPWYRHVVQAPGLWTGYGAMTFPGVVEAIDDKDWVRAAEWVEIIETKVKAATKVLS